MQLLLYSRLITWALLVTATLVSVEFIGWLIPGQNAILAIMGLAAAKASLVAWSFMDMASAPRAWQVAFALLFWIGAAMIAMLSLLA